MNIITVVIIVSVLLGLAFFGLAIQIIFKKEHKFPNMHIGGNKNMLKNGITCAQSWDKMEQRNARKIEVESLNLKNR